MLNVVGWAYHYIHADITVIHIEIENNVLSEESQFIYVDVCTDFHKYKKMVNIVSPEFKSGRLLQQCVLGESKFTS